MTHTRIAAAVALVFAVTLSGGHLSAQSGYDLFQKALAAERADGNLQQAIQLYARVAKEFAGDRALAARALIRLAECYQKLGDREAERVYQRVLREYADQSEAASIARAYLSHQAPAAAAKSDRPIWTGPAVDPSGQVSPDGRFITYVDWNGDQVLMVHDIVNNTDRPLTATPTVRFSEFAEFSTISRDGKRVAYTWVNPNLRRELRVVPLQGTPSMKPQQLLAANDDISSIAPLDWSPDGKWIAVNLQRTDGTGQIALLDTANGSLRILKSVDWRGADKIAFSPDGRFIAYDLAVAETDAERHVYVMAVDASAETAVAAHPSKNVVVAWSPDGQHVLFASNRSGDMALWAQRVAGGKPQGAPALLKRGIGSSIALGLTNAGVLYVYKGRSANYVQVTDLDLEAGKIASATAGSFQRFVGSGGGPQWATDGKFLAYRSCDTAPRRACALAIASVETGQVRELRPALAYIQGARWSADSRSLMTGGIDFKGRRGIYRIDARTGELSTVFPTSPGNLMQSTPDERKIYFRRGPTIMERDLASGVEREVFRQTQTETESLSIKISPDGRYIATVTPEQALYLIPTAGGPPQELTHATGGEKFDGYRLEWTPDSQAVVVPKVTGDNRFELWLVPVADARHARRIDANTDEWILPGGGFAIHPDGRHVAFVGAAGKQGPEVWVLENFLPASSAKR